MNQHKARKVERLWDELGMLRCVITRSDCNRAARFGVHVRNDNRERTPPLV
jgi:hypothetical protein